MTIGVGLIQRLLLPSGLITDFFGTLTNTTYILDASAPFGYIINAYNGVQLTSGTATLAIQIGGVNVTGLSGIAATSTPQNVTATGANVVAIGNQVSLVVTGAASPVNLSGTLAIVL